MGRWRSAVEGDPARLRPLAGRPRDGAVAHVQGSEQVPRNPGPIAGPEQVGRQGVGGVLAGLDQARLAEELPMFPPFRPRLVAEVRPAVDRYDPDPAAVRALVLARAATPPKVRGARRSGREEAREGRAWGAR